MKEALDEKEKELSKFAKHDGSLSYEALIERNRTEKQQNSQKIEHLESENKRLAEVINLRNRELVEKDAQFETVKQHMYNEELNKQTIEE